MANVSERLDEIEKRIVGGLKDFQRETVNRIAYLYRHGQNRVLVSDEVGLGKTLVARGTVAKVAKMHRDQGDPLFKVVYICSNTAIADQNLQKLRITNEVVTESVSSSRLSMQHLNIFFQESNTELLNRYIQLIPLTPDTSFRMTAGTGTVSERALMFAILEQLDELKYDLDQLEVAMKDWAKVAWPYHKSAYEGAVKRCNDSSKGKYLEYMLPNLRVKLNAVWYDNQTYLDGIKKLCQRIRENNNSRVGSNGIIGQLRVIFAELSLKRLDPDLVIMDEFQRFKDLLDSKGNGTETGMLAKEFFDTKGVKMLLLSATPYKLYSTPEEIDEAQIDEHYTEFLKVMEFLNESDKRQTHFKTVWKNYSAELREASLGDTTVLSTKMQAEKEMYKSVCRTERISEKLNADIIKDRKEFRELDVSEQDIRSYIEIQELIDSIEDRRIHVPVDYIKSSPYLLSFMKDYELKREIEKYFKAHPGETKKAKKDTLWLNRNTVDRYDIIPNNNARLDRIMQTVIQDNMDKMLWIPPSRPYYPLQGIYKDAGQLTKTLVFSSWEMVPRMLSSLISYEVERRTVGILAKEKKEEDVHYFYDESKRYPPARLIFNVKSGSPNAMALFCLLYPSQYLSKIYNPIECMNKKMALRSIEKGIKERIDKQLKRFTSPKNGKPDARWYYLAPLLLDGEEAAYRWLNEDALELNRYNDEENKTATNPENFQIHLDTLKTLLQETLREQCRNLGKKPSDLSNVLTDIAIASPAVSFL